MGLHLPLPRKNTLLLRLWLNPTNLIGRAVARLVGAQGPYPVGSDRAPAEYYLLPDNFRWWFGAVALGHVILAQPGFLRGEAGRWIMAHELSHTRQHDLLGPLYLPLHGTLQALSALFSMFRPIPGYSIVHAYNPLERAFICVPFDYLVSLRAGSSLEDKSAEEVLRAFGVSEFSCHWLKTPQ
jgi:hypothetical protein